MQVEFNSSVYKDPTMRSRLEAYYDQKYQPVYERIAKMEADGYEAPTVRLRGEAGAVATELSPAQYRAAIPSFDKWLELQQQLTDIESRVFGNDALARAQTRVETLEANTPSSPSGVRSVFSTGDQILGYLNNDGTVVTHSGGGALSAVAKQADQLNLTGEARIDYIRSKGAEALSVTQSDLDVTNYTESDMPSKRAFAARWYPQHNVDDAYQTALEEAAAHVAFIEAQQKRVAKNRDDMMSFLLQSLQGEDSAVDSDKAAAT